MFVANYLMTRHGVDCSVGSAVRVRRAEKAVFINSGERLRCAAAPADRIEATWHEWPRPPRRPRRSNATTRTPGAVQAF